MQRPRIGRSPWLHHVPVRFVSVRTSRRFTQNNIVCLSDGNIKLCNQEEVTHPSHHHRITLYLRQHLSITRWQRERAECGVSGGFKFQYFCCRGLRIPFKTVDAYLQCLSWLFCWPGRTLVYLVVISECKAFMFPSTHATGTSITSTCVDVFRCWDSFQSWPQPLTLLHGLKLEKRLQKGNTRTCFVPWNH